MSKKRYVGNEPARTQLIYDRAEKEINAIVTKIDTAGSDTVTLSRYGLKLILAQFADREVMAFQDAMEVTLDVKIAELKSQMLP